MDFLQDYIVPIIVVIIWIAGKFFGGKLEEDDGRPPTRPQPAEQAERARQIQEEIRRKIEDRRRQAQSEQPQPASNPPPPLLPQTAHPSQPPPLVAAPAADYQEQLRQRRQQILEAQARAEAAKQEAAKQIAKARGSAGPAVTLSGPVPIGGSPARFVRAALASPLSARNAFVFQEVVGPPVALRTSERIGAVEF